MSQSSLVVAPASRQSSYVVAPLPLGGVFQSYNSLANGTFFNPNSIATGAPSTSTNAGYLTFTSTSPGTSSPLPNQGAYVSFAVRNIYGQTSSIDQVDLMKSILRTLTNGGSAPTDVILWAVLTAGALGATSRGCGCYLAATTGNWVAGHTVNTGAGWANTNATSNSASTVGSVLNLSTLPSPANGRVSSHPIDSSNALIAAANTGSVASSSTALGNAFDTISVGFGWLTGVGGVGGALTARVDLAFLKNTDLQLPSR